MIVTSRYIGRLGNNMFQLAAAIGYARRYGGEWRSLAQNEECPEFYNYFPNLPTSPPRGRAYQCHDPSTFNYKPIKNQGSVNLMGFFQSLKYFEHCQDEVKEVFKLPVNPDMYQYCSIHVRRGDYVKYKDSFPPVSLRYISAAMATMKADGVDKFMVFSDDIEWCKANIKGVEFSQGNPFEDMANMASCSNHIIANSSFSWWGAYLGINPDKHIISPSACTWFGKKNGVTMAIGTPKDLIPDGWQQIDL